MRQAAVGIDPRLAGFVLTPVLAWLALPGSFSFWPLLVVCLVPLFLLIESSQTIGRAFWFGLLAGVGFYALQIYWIVPVLMQYGGLPWYLAGPAMLLLAIYMSLYLAVFSAAFFLLSASARVAILIFGAPPLWVGLDWLRSWLFSGFPWMDIGYGLWSEPFLLQAADLFGHYGYTFLIVLFNVVAYSFFSSRIPLKRCFAGGATAAALVGVLLIYCLYRFEKVEEQVAKAPAPVIGIVQGNIKQGQKWSATERERTVQKYLSLSADLTASSAAALVVWPETALPFYPIGNKLLLPIADFTRRTGVPLLTGSPWYEVEVDKTARQPYFYNSALLVGAGGRFIGRYYKTHLVPYGEYVPLKRYLPFLAPLVEAAGDFSAGRIEEPLRTGEIRAGVLICFESIFEALARAWVDSGANVLVNLTNDAWYGKSSAPYQSWAMTVYRAVETRRSLVRSANTGISGVIDPLGRIVDQSDIFIEWAAAGPVVLLDEKSVFVQGGYAFAPGCGALALLALITAVWTKRSRRGAAPEDRPAGDSAPQ